MRFRVAPSPALLPYQRQWLRGDVFAGLTAGAVVIPQAMAYATVANMPVEFGLYSCMLPMVVYALTGGSRSVSVSTTSTVATLTASTMLGAGVLAGSSGAPSELMALTLLVGVILLVARVLRLGSVVENINEATLIGLKAGVGLTIAAGQLPKLLGVKPDPNHEGFFRVLASALRQLGHAHLMTVVLSLASIGLLWFIGRAYPKVPGPLVVAGLGIAGAAFGGLTALGVKLIPAVPEGLPVPGWPAFDQIGHLLPGALAIAMMAFLETVSAARGIRHRDDAQIEPDRELSALGLAAVAGAFFHALPPSGGFSQSQVNTRAGARSQVSGLVTAALAVVVALLLAPVLSKLPEATLGAMVLVPVLGLIEVRALRQLWTFSRREFTLAILVMAVALTVGLLPAVAVGVLLTLYAVLHNANQPHVVQVVKNDGISTDGPEGELVHPADPLVLRTQVALYTANLRANTRMIRIMALSADPPPKTLVVDLSRQLRISTTILDGLRDLDADLDAAAVRVEFTAMPAAALALARRSPWWQDVEREGRYRQV
ncbi:SulP family inorganic anion transporter [Mycobacterium aquaticum]|uniref:Sulfate transporter n=1 Tax=Mycobacterium aquaticum TaxID=1927124 RepID=A0A1X0B493_9MYCO|nr:SulP family inorganic anion transporter [Mycobacterium aquaticum]ORA37120.1 sulfate transporter [Mycobacterium aquaticum]